MAGKIGKALGFSMDLGETPREKKHSKDEGDVDISDEFDLSGPEDELDAPESDNMAGDEGEPKTSDSTAETLAMRMFSKATTDAGKVAALKAFGEACGWGGESY